MMSDYVSVACYRCKENFGMAREYYNVAKRSGHDWYCPNGHQQHFVEGPTEAQKLREQLANVEQEKSRLRQQIAERNDRILQEQEARAATERSLSATRGVVTRIKNRVAAGTCPCCNRHFQNLARHMHGQHPDYASKEEHAGA